MAHYFGTKMKKEDKERFFRLQTNPFPAWEEFMGKPVPFQAMRDFLHSHPRGGGKVLKYFDLDEKTLYDRVRRDDYYWYRFKNCVKFVELCEEHGITFERTTLCAFIAEFPQLFCDQHTMEWSEIKLYCRLIPAASPLFNLFCNLP